MSDGPQRDDSPDVSEPDDLDWFIGSQRLNAAGDEAMEWLDSIPQRVVGLDVFDFGEG